MQVVCPALDTVVVAFCLLPEFDLKHMTEITTNLLNDQYVPHPADENHDKSTLLHGLPVCYRDTS